MKNKLDKIKEIKELLDSGTITDLEFEKLKSEIINQSEESKSSEISLENSSVTKVFEPFAIVTLVTSVLGLLIFPRVLYIICFIASLISYYQIQGNEKYKGTEIRIAGYIIMIAGIWYTSNYYGIKLYEIFIGNL